ncbi:uncharacterized protein V6R79_004790 [Siganus canaliculatus]
MTSLNPELKKISTELKHLSLKRQQLLEKKKIQVLFQELRNRAEFDQTEEAASNQCEIDSIDNTLKQLSEKQADLQKSYNSILESKSSKKKDVSFASTEKTETTVPPVTSPDSKGASIIYVEAPPSIPAPTVILDVENLPPSPSRTQCPECREFIVTETVTSISSVTWLVCLMTALMGCVAGCCLIPFCMKRFKSTTHRCPKCRSPIQTVKKL